MHLPTPNKGESTKAFIERVLNSDEMKEAFPDEEERLTVCYSQARLSQNSTFHTLSGEIGTIRTEDFDGIEHTVIPVVAMIEGVHQAANAPNPELALASEFGRFPIAWNGRPVTIDHPQVRGTFVSANSPSVLADVRVGQVFNPSVEDGKLKLEAWVDPSRLNEEGQKILDKVKGGEITEISVGVFSEIEPIKGTFNGKEFNGVWRNPIPDHLALLSDGKVGACSVEEGCGTGRFHENSCDCKKSSTFSSILVSLRKLLKKDEEPKELTAEDIKSFSALSDFDKRAAIQSALEINKEGGFVLDVFEDTFIMETFDGLFERKYSISEEGTISLGSERVQVRPETKYIQVKTEIVDMSKKEEKVAALIANEATNFTDKDKEFLLSLEEDKLDLLSPKEVEKEKTPKANEDKSKETKKENLKEVTVEEYLAQAPKAVGAFLQSALSLQDKTRNELITNIKANEKNKFSEEQLKSMDLGMLENLAALAVNEDYSGRGGPRKIKVEDITAPEPRSLFSKAS